MILALSLIKLFHLGKLKWAVEEIQLLLKQKNHFCIYMYVLGKDILFSSVNPNNLHSSTCPFPGITLSPSLPGESVEHFNSFIPAP